jgi:hypothetical protein
MNIYGVKWPVKKHTKTQLIEYSEKLNFYNKDLHLIDTSLVTKITPKGIDSISKIEIASRYACPVQIMFFDNEKKLVSHQTICHSDDAKKKWNFKGLSSDLIPKTEVSIDSLSLNFEKINDFLVPKIELKEKKSLIILVFWSRTLWRQSKNLSKAVNEFILNSDKFEIFYVNMDDFLLDSKAKLEVEIE